MDERQPDDDLQELLKRSATLLPGLMFNAFEGYSTHLHQIDKARRICVPVLAMTGASLVKPAKRRAKNGATRCRMWCPGSNHAMK